MNKKNLEIHLSKLSVFDKAKIKLEQYQIESSVAAEVLWQAFMNNDIKDKVIADFGCGNGILGIGALLLNAKKVYFIDIDKEILEITKKNLNIFKEKNFVVLNKDVKDFKNKVDTVIQNPPFGVKNRYADRVFLIKAMELANVIYSFHKIESKNLIEKLAKENGFTVYSIKEVKMLLKRSFKFHKKNKYYVDIGIWRLKKLIYR